MWLNVVVTLTWHIWTASFWWRRNKTRCSPCHGSDGYSLVFQRGGPDFIPGQSVCDLWWSEWQFYRFFIFFDFIP